MEVLWSLYNKFEKLRIDDLKTAQVRTILLAIPTARMSDWYACRQGDLHWQPLSDLPDFHEDVCAVKGESLPQQPVAPPRRPLFEDMPADVVTDTSLTVDSADTKERRSARRYHRQLTFEFSDGKNTFQSQTVDISMNGFALENEIPDWVPRTFRAKLEHKGQSTQVHCSKVDGRKLKLKDADSWELIRHWIVSW